MLLRQLDPRRMGLMTRDTHGLTPETDPRRVYVAETVRPEKNGSNALSMLLRQLDPRRVGLLPCLCC